MYGKETPDYRAQRSQGEFPDLDAVVQHVGRPRDEWVRIDDRDLGVGWYHGGGNEAGEYYFARPVLPE